MNTQSVTVMVEGGECQCQNQISVLVVPPIPQLEEKIAVSMMVVLYLCVCDKAVTVLIHMKNYMAV